MTGLLSKQHCNKIHTLLMKSSASPFYRQPLTYMDYPPPRPPPPPPPPSLFFKENLELPPSLIFQDSHSQSLFK